MIEVPCEIIVVYHDQNDTSAPVVRRLELKYPNLKGAMNSRGRGVLTAVTADTKAARGRYALIYAADEIGPLLAIEPMLRLMRQGYRPTSRKSQPRQPRNSIRSRATPALTGTICKHFSPASGKRSSS